MAKANLWVCVYDLHYPDVDKPTFNAILDFLSRNKTKVSGFLWGGDQFSNDEISHHNAHKPIYKPTGSYKRNTKGFDETILKPVESLLAPRAERVWIKGNHDDFERQLIEGQPELEGTIERDLLLNLESRRWNVIECGDSYKLGKLTAIHGEVLSGIGNQASGYHAKKATEIFCGSVLYGHMHSFQAYTKILPYRFTDKWVAYCSPIAGKTNPIYLRNRPTAWLNGFTIVEVQSDGNFQVYPVVISGGKFSFAGEVYGGKKS